MRSIVTSLLLLAALPLFAQPAFRATGGAFFAISVADMKTSVAWYTEKLGLKVAQEMPGKVSVAILEGGGLTVELIHDGDARAAAKTASPHLVRGIFKAGLVVADFDATVKTLRERGVKFVAGPFPKKPDQAANVVIEDHAGNLIQFFGER